jgi:hypothetical protein
MDTIMEEGTELADCGGNSNFVQILSTNQPFQ